MTFLHKTKIQFKNLKQRLLFLFLIKSIFYYENDMANCIMKRKLIVLKYPPKNVFILFESIRKFEVEFSIWNIKGESNIKQISKISWLTLTSEITGSKTCIFDPNKQVKVVFFSWKRNSYPHTSLSFRSSKYVTLHIRNISLLFSTKVWHIRNTRKKLSNQISQTIIVKFENLFSKFSIFYQLQRFHPRTSWLWGNYSLWNLKYIFSKKAQIFVNCYCYSIFIEYFSSWDIIFVINCVSLCLCTYNWPNFSGMQ